MRDRNRSDLLLVEILIAVFFFMLSLTVLVQLFAQSRNTVLEANAGTEALLEAQNIAEELYGSEDAGKLLADRGFVSSHGVYTKRYDSYSLMVSLTDQQEEAGTMQIAELKAYYNRRQQLNTDEGDEALLTIPCSWYLPSNGAVG